MNLLKNVVTYFIAAPGAPDYLVPTVGWITIPDNGPIQFLPPQPTEGSITFQIVKGEIYL